MFLLTLTYVLMDNCLSLVRLEPVLEDEENASRKSSSKVFKSIGKIFLNSLSNCFFFKYCDSNIELLSFAHHIVIALPPLSLLTSFLNFLYWFIHWLWLLFVLLFQLFQPQKLLLFNNDKFTFTLCYPL